MAIYVVVFTASSFLFKLGDSVRKKQGIYLGIYLDYIAIFSLCLLAGFRAETIGTDTAGYIQPMIKGAISSGNVKDFLKYSWMGGYLIKNISDYEIGYSLVVYLLSTIFKSIVVTQTILELLVVIPIYYALRKKEDVPIWFGMPVFMLQFFNGSMNLNRQSIAMSFMLLSVTCWMSGEKKKCVLFLICSVLFHTSGLLGVINISLYEYVGKNRENSFESSNKDTYYRNMIIAIFVGVATLISIKYVINIMTILGFGNYVGYIKGDIHFMPNQIINILPPIIILVFSKINFQSHKNEWAFYIVMMIYTIIAGQFASVYPNSGRIRLYFMIFVIFAYPLACKYSSRKKILSLAMIAYLMFYWWFYYVLQGTDHTVPYVRIH